MSNNGYDKLPSNQDVTLPPQEKTSLFSILSFGWLNDVFKAGNVRPLEQSDFLPLDEHVKARVLTEQLQNLWNEELKACVGEAGKTPKLWKTVMKMMTAKEVCFMLILTLLEALCGFLQPLLLGLIISKMTSSNPDRGLLYGSAVLLVVTALGKGVSMHHRYIKTDFIGARCIVALKGIAYCKIHRLSLQTLQGFTEGHVIDLVSNDVQTMEEAPLRFFDSMQSLFSLPTVVLLFLYFFDWAALMGVVFLLALVPFFLLVSSIAAHLRLQTALVSDRRISVLNELVSGIRAVKTHAWESHYLEMVNKLRRNEIWKIRKKSFPLSTVEGVITTTGAIATFLSFSSLVLTGNAVTSTNAFMLLAFMLVLRRYMSITLGRGLPVLYQAFVSLNRIGEFLMLDNLPQVRGGNPSCDHQDLLGETETVIRGNNDSKDLKLSFQASAEVLSVSDLSCKLAEENNGRETLQNVSFEVPNKGLTIITGPVGSGKSTLLSSIAGEVKLSCGTVTYPGSLVYVPQLPWIYSGTLRENILFGERYDEQWYEEVIQACALSDDMDRFPDKDDTIVGERGVLLSGGQKARVSLARAVYASSDVYLLDDPLSAVDIKVGQHIFQRCICDLMSTKIRVLVSYQKSHMEKADQVVVLESGYVLAKGVFSEVENTSTISGILSDHIQSALSDEELFKDKTHLQAITTCEERSTYDQEKGLVIPDEDRAIGKVSFRLYWKYFKAANNQVAIIVLIALFFVSQAIMVSPDLWLFNLTKKTLEMQQDAFNLSVYAGLATAALLTATLRAMLLFFICLKSSEYLHDKMVASILQAPVSFFDTNPAGRILNRLSKDIGSIDELLPMWLLFSLQFYFLALAAALVPAIANFWLLFILTPILVAFVLLTRYYLNTSRDLKRLESTCRSPVFSLFSETLNGLDTIRTRAMEKEFIDRFYRREDVHNQAAMMAIAGDRWFAIRIDVLCTLFVGAVALFIVLFSTDPGMAGLSLAYVLETVTYTQIAVRYFSDVENLMTSVERVMTYCSLESEPGYKNDTSPPAQWPHDGHVTFTDVSLTYYPGGPQVLRNLNINVKGKAKIGVVGRTGAGKSSILAALLRMPEADGDITIDGVKINDINLQESRRCISVLSQTPVLFSGPLKKNLDPLGQHQEVDLWAALEEVQLKSLVENFDGRLDYELSERGANLSVGERQLICLARTLLQRNKIIILDEPTAYVDPITEQTIWSTVHEKLKDSTVITIAHRLNTIRDCDAILVLKDGEVVEFDRFDILLGREGGVLASMAQQATM